MILARHVAKMLGATLAYGVSTRRATLVLLVLLGIALVGLITATQAVAPIIIYPFV